MNEVNNCFSIYHTSWITSGPKSNFIGDNIPTKANLFFAGCSEMNSTWLITSEVANQRAQKVLVTCVVYTNVRYLHSPQYCFSNPKPKNNIHSRVQNKVFTWTWFLCAPLLLLSISSARSSAMFRGGIRASTRKDFYSTATSNATWYRHRPAWPASVN